jgi:hypothetical protein
MNLKARETVFEKRTVGMPHRRRSVQETMLAT